MRKHLWTGLLAGFILLDLAFSFWRNYQLPLDGDLAAAVLPAPWYAQVLHDPFGWSVLTKGAVYSGPNRFFAHAALSGYWKLAPRALQLVLAPIESLYVASALATTAVQAGLLLLLAGLARCASAGRGLGYWATAALLVPLFQTAGGYYEQMGLTDRAVTYTFFYGLAMLPTLLLLWPFAAAAWRGQPLRLAGWQLLLLLALEVVVAFNGPVAGASAAVGLLLAGGYWAWGRGQRWRGQPAGGSWLSGQALGLLAALGLLCAYSLYIGRNNIENSHTYSLRQLYALLPDGTWRYLLYQPGLPVLLLALAASLGLLGWRVPAAAPGRRQLLATLGWLALFGGAYLLLLPLGGYRSYRPNLLRNDSALPLLLALVAAYGSLASYLLRTLHGRWRGGYLVGVVALGVFFLAADGRPDATPTNDCERWALDQLARTHAPVVQLSTYCQVLTWLPATEPGQSDIQAQMLQYWHVTPTKKLYYQK